MMKELSLLDIPNEILLTIISYIDWDTIQCLKSVNKRLHDICDSSFIHENAMKTKYGSWILNPKYINGCINYKINIYELCIENQIDTICKYIYKNKWNIVKFLIRYVIERNTRNRNGDTLGIVLVSLSSCYLEVRNIFELLLKQRWNNIDIKATNGDGRSVLTYACLKCDLDMIKSILKTERFTYLDITKRDKYGWTSIMYAIVYNKSEITRYLHNNYNIVLSKNDALEISVHVKTRNIVQGRWNFNDTLRRINEIEDFEDGEISVDYNVFLNNEEISTDYTDDIESSPNEACERLINEEEILEENMKIVSKNCKMPPGDYIKYIAMETDIIQWVEDMYFLYKNSTELEEKKHILMKIYNTIINLPNDYTDGNAMLIDTNLLVEINQCIYEIHTQTKNDNIWKKFIFDNKIELF